jgi:D-lactate dehydrogenase (cytochrome)
VTDSVDQGRGTTTSTGLLAELSQLLGEQRVDVDTKTRSFYSTDVYRAGSTPLAVVRPASTHEVVAIVNLARSANCAIHVRGGGMSYTDAWIPTSEQAIVMDTSSLSEVCEIDAEGLHATVGAGLTWQGLDNALAEHGVRSVFWGPMSGKLATVGGAMSQGAATFGSGRHGTSAAAALGFEAVTGDGRVLQTGCAGQPGRSNFFRPYGPDLTGLLTGDAGALGIKTAVTLQLEPRPAYSGGLSFAFESFESLVSATGRIAAEGLATEVFGAETALARLVAQSISFEADLKTLLAVGRAAPGPLAGIRRMLSIATAGRRFLDQSNFTISYLAEARNAPLLRQELAALRNAVGNDGYEIPNTMAAVTRATPFPDPMVLGPGGRRLLPLHAVVPFRNAIELHEEVQQFIEARRDELARHDIDVFLVYSTLGRSCFLYELVIYWPDTWNELHRATLPAELLKHFAESEPQPGTRKLVDDLKNDFVDIMFRHGSAHMQIGRMYPYTRERDDTALSMLRQIKSDLDPQGIINPWVWKRRNRDEHFGCREACDRDCRCRYRRFVCSAGTGADRLRTRGVRAGTGAW